MSGTRLQIPVSTSLHNAKSAVAPRRRPADVANFSAPHHSLSQIKLQSNPKPQRETTQILPVEQEADLGAENFQPQEQGRQSMGLPDQAQANARPGQDLLALTDEILTNTQPIPQTAAVPQNQAVKETNPSAQKSLNNQTSTIKGAAPPGSLLKQEAAETPTLTPTGAQSATQQLAMPSLTAPRQAPLFSSQREEFTISSFAKVLSILLHQHR